MPEYPLNTSAVGTIAADGTCTVTIGPQIVREAWDVTSTTVTALGTQVVISQYGNPIDSTIQDPRPTATDNTPFHLASGNVLSVKWSNGTPGNGVQVTVLGKRRVGR